MLNDPFWFLQELVLLESSSGEESAIAEYVMNVLEERGVEYTIQPLGGSFNIIAGDLSEKPKLTVAAHIDTIPLEKSVRLEGDHSSGLYLIGRGVIDDLASVAVLLSLIVDLERLPNGLQIAFFAQEETTGFGSLYYLQAYRPKYAIVMEPTNNVFHVSGHGVITFELIAIGPGKHPDVAANFEDDRYVGNRLFEEGAAERLIEAYRRLREKLSLKPLILGIEAPYNEHLTPTKAKMLLELSVPPGVAIRELIEELKELTKGLGLRILDASPGFITSDKAFLEALAGEISEHPFPGRCDANRFAAKGIPVAIFGPGETRRLHTEYERIGPTELARALSVLEDTIERVLRL